MKMKNERNNKEEKNTKKKRHKQKFYAFFSHKQAVLGGVILYNINGVETRVSEIVDCMEPHFGDAVFVGMVSDKDMIRRLDEGKRQEFLSHKSPLLTRVINLLHEDEKKKLMKREWAKHMEIFEKINKKT